MKHIFVFLVALSFMGCVAQQSEIDQNNAFPIKFGVGDKPYGYIDRDGKFISNQVYDMCDRFSEGYANVRIKGISYVIDKYGSLTRIGKISLFKDFHDGLAVVAGDMGWGCIDTKGKWVIKPISNQIYDFSEGFALVEDIDNDCFYFIDKNGKNIFGKTFEGAGSFSDGLTWVKINGKCSFINRYGKTVITTPYESVGSFQDGLASFKSTVNDKEVWGFLDKEGKIVISAIFNNVGCFNEGYADACGENGWGIIDIKGQWIIEPKYDRVYPPHESVVAFQMNDKWGFIGLDGKIIHEATFDDLDLCFFKDGMALVSNYVVTDGMNYSSYGYLKKDGSVIWGKDIKY